MSTKSLSHLGTLSFEEGMLGFKMRKKGGEYHIGDHLLFYPCVFINKYSVSDTNERFLKHILYDLYEFTFIAIDKYQLDYYDDDEDFDYDRWKNTNHYLIEIMPGFSAFHANWLKRADEYLQIGTLYHGFGRLSNYGDEALDNPDTAPEVMKRILCRGILEKLEVNGIWRDSYEHVAPIIETICDGYGYDDVLKSIGYPEDMTKFQGYISRYQQDQSSFESTAQNKNSRTLVYSIRMA